MKKINIFLVILCICSCSYPYSFEKFDTEISHAFDKSEFYFIYRDSVRAKNDKIYSFNTDTKQLKQIVRHVQMGKILDIQKSKNDSILYYSSRRFENRFFIYSLNSINLISNKIDTLLTTKKHVSGFEVDENRNQIYYPLYDKYLDSPTRSVGNLEHRIYSHNMKTRESYALLETTMETIGGFAGKYKLINDRYLFFSGMKNVKDKIQMSKDIISYSYQTKLFLYNIEDKKLIDLGELNKFFRERFFSIVKVWRIELIGSDEEDCFFVAHENEVYKFCLQTPSKLTRIVKLNEDLTIFSINPTHRQSMFCVALDYDIDEFVLIEIDYNGKVLYKTRVKELGLE